MVENDQRPHILQLNTKGLTANKISVIKQLVYKNKAFVSVLQETHSTTADKLVIPNFSLAGSILIRKHGFATFVHERLEWSRVNQSLEQLCPTHGPWATCAQSKVSCVPVQVFAVVKVSYNLTTCPYVDNREFDT